MSTSLLTGRGAVEADEPVDLSRGNWHVSSTNTSPVDVGYSWLKRVAIGVNPEATESTMPDISGIGKPHPLRHWRPYAITRDHNLTRVKFEQREMPVKMETLLVYIPLQI